MDETEEDNFSMKCISNGGTRLYANGGYSWVSGSSTGVWFHVAIERQGDTLVYYKNGVQSGTRGLSTGQVMNYSGKTAVFGAAASNPGGNFNGGRYAFDLIRVVLGQNVYGAAGFTLPTSF